VLEVPGAIAVLPDSIEVSLPKLFFSQRAIA
jgi:hypothetical protein